MSCLLNTQHKSRDHLSKLPRINSSVSESSTAATIAQKQRSLIEITENQLFSVRIINGSNYSYQTWLFELNLVKFIIRSSTIQQKSWIASSNLISCFGNNISSTILIQSCFSRCCFLSLPLLFILLSFLCALVSSDLISVSVLTCLTFFVFFCRQNTPHTNVSKRPQRYLIRYRNHYRRINWLLTDVAHKLSNQMQEFSVAI